MRLFFGGGGARSGGGSVPDVRDVWWQADMKLLLARSAFERHPSVVEVSVPDSLSIPWLRCGVLVETDPGDFSGSGRQPS